MFIDQLNANTILLKSAAIKRKEAVKQRQQSIICILSLVLLVPLTVKAVAPKPKPPEPCSMTAWYMAELETEEARKEWAVKKLKAAKAEIRALKQKELEPKAAPTPKSLNRTSSNSIQIKGTGFPNFFRQTLNRIKYRSYIIAAVKRHGYSRDFGLMLIKHIEQKAVQYNLEPEFITSVIMHESGFNPRAVSHCGAVGLGQLMPQTAKDLGVNPWNLVENIEGTAKYLAQLSKQFNGNKKLILAAYNAGPGAVIKYKGIPAYSETQRYVPSVLAHYNTYKEATV